MQPNVLVIVLDATRQDHTSAYGYQRQTTPNLEQLAADGYLFEQAFAAAPWTPPSHGSIFSGVYPSFHHYLDRGMKYDPPHQTLAERLRNEGYNTFGAGVNAKISGGTEVTRGFNEWGDLWRPLFIPSSPSEMREYYLDLIPDYFNAIWYSRKSERKPVEYLTNGYVKRRINRYGGSKPFFGFININSPHDPYAPPEPFRRRFSDPQKPDTDSSMTLCRGGKHQYRAGKLELTSNEWAAVQARYDGEIAFADFLAGELFNSLRRAGVYDETLVIVTADHGEHFGEHGRAGHQFSLFDEVLRVPLIVKPPVANQHHKQYSSMVSLIDIYPTVLATVGLSIPTSVQGSNLLENPGHDVVFAEYGRPTGALETMQEKVDEPLAQELVDELDHPLQCARTESRKYIHVLGGQDTAYAVSNETVPMDTRLTDETLEDLKNRLLSTLNDDLEVNQEHSDDKAVRKNLQDLGYM